MNQYMRGKAPSERKAAGSRSNSAAVPVGLQAQAGNAAMVQMLRQAGHPWAQDSHQHSSNCGHRVEGAGVQRSAQETVEAEARPRTVDDHSPEGQRALIDQAMASPSRRLPEPLLQAAKPYFQNENLDVTRLHDNPVAQRATEAMGAQAMTIGTHIFAPPEAVRNMHLMGHELSHVNENLNGTRETGKSNGAGVIVTDPGQNSELKADRDGVSFAAGAASAPSVVTQRATRNAGTPATAGGETEAEPTVQRAPSGYDYSSYYTDDVPMVIDAEPGYGSSSGYPQVSYSSYTLPPGYEGREDDRGRSSSRASYGYSRPSSRAPSRYREDVEMDLDDGAHIIDADPGRSSSRAPYGYSRRSSRAPSRDRGGMEMELDDGAHIIDAAPGSSRRRHSRTRRHGGSERSRESSYSRPKGIEKSYPKPTSENGRKVWSIAGRVMAQTKQIISRGAANQISSAAANGGGLTHLISTVRNPEYRLKQPSTFQEMLGQNAAAAEALGVGNCGEHAAVSFCLLNKEKLPSGYRIWHVSLSIDHAFVAVGNPKKPNEIIILDAWQDNASLRMAGENLHFAFLVNGQVTPEATPYKPDGKDYMALGRKTVDIAAMTNTMDTTGPAIDPTEFAGVPGMYRQEMRPREEGALNPMDEPRRPHPRERRYQESMRERYERYERHERRERERRDGWR